MLAKKTPIFFFIVASLVVTLGSLFLHGRITFDRDGEGFGPPSMEETGTSDKQICFVQSVFGRVGQPSLDRPQNVTLQRQDYPDYRFFYFTNIPTLETPGWDKVIWTDLPYNRFITQSRYAKFLAWKYPPILHSCRFVLYMDGQFRPRSGRRVKLEMLASQAKKASPCGLLQQNHPRGGTLQDEFDRIVSGSKDTQEHVDASIRWLEAQPDFDNNATLYYNGVFGTWLLVF